MMDKELVEAIRSLLVANMIYDERGGGYVHTETVETVIKYLEEKEGYVIVKKAYLDRIRLIMSLSTAKPSNDPR